MCQSCRFTVCHNSTASRVVPLGLLASGFNLNWQVTIDRSADGRHTEYQFA
jgi:hypothetical protein